LKQDSDWGRFVVHEEERKICGQVSDIAVLTSLATVTRDFLTAAKKTGMRTRPLQMTSY
jgi:hypothetical protein